jgi:predicted transposase YdaD
VFRFVLSRVEHARGPLRALVGDELAAGLEWTTLRLVPGSYVEEALRDSMSDLLFAVRFRGSDRHALAYLLWDHQRRPDRLMPLRLFNYGGRALHDYTEGADAISGYVPTLIPILVYQGPGEWPGPYLLSDLSMLPGEPPPPILADLRMIVHELRDDSLPPAELTELARTTFRLLRLAALGQLVVANAERIARWLDDVHEAYGYDDHRALLEYIYAAGSDEGMIEAIIEHTREDLKDTVMSIADKLEARGWAKGEAKGRAEGEAKGRAEGEAKGRAEGEARGRATLLLRQLERRFGSLPPLVATSVLAATPEQVEAWALRLLDASTLDELLRDA